MEEPMGHEEEAQFEELRPHPYLVPRPPFVDIDQIRAWRQVCQNTHGDCCNNRHSEQLSKYLESLILVDVHIDALVVLPSSTPFVALSYVWGNVQMLKTLTSNLSDLMKPGALRKDGAMKIPNTIRDAIHLVKTLGERYLWVDCLCVVQDQDQYGMDTMLRAMARIYTSAEFVIVAADGSNANYGLHGTKGLSSERLPHLVGRRNQSITALFKSVWGSRGWTFQEALFARRILIFHEVVYWVCSLCEWAEELKSTDKGSDAIGETLISPTRREHFGWPMGLMSLLTKLPQLWIWDVLVERYTGRDLTYKHDIERAIAGATEVLGPTFPGGILHGLPVFFFDVVLLWRPRKPSPRREWQPSWSWLGWEGPTQ